VAGIDELGGLNVPGSGSRPWAEAAAAEAVACAIASAAAHLNNRIGSSPVDRPRLRAFAPTVLCSDFFGHKPAIPARWLESRCGINMANHVSSGAVARGPASFFLLLAPAAAGDRPPSAAMPAVVGASERVVAEQQSGLALNGFDPVTYFLGAPRAGDPGRDLIWSGVGWRFVNEANREAFRRDPEGFAPHFGGYDPVAVSQGHAAAADPALFAVVDGRLYVFRNEDSRRRFLADPGLAERAATRWPDLRARLAGD
jgi:hypothetical protein